MSASKDKLQRRQQIEAGTDKRSVAQAKQAAAHRKKTIAYSAIAVLLVVFFAFTIFYTSAFASRELTAVTINGVDYSVAQLNYHYSTSYMSFYSNNYSYISYGLFFDPNESLAKQAYSEDMTWRDYFIQAAVDEMTQIQMLNDRAEADGFTLSEEQQAEYEEQLASMETSWEDLGYASLQQYLNLNYGKGVDQSVVEQEMYRTYVASAYSQSVYDGYEYSDAELDDYYAEHANELDVIDYAYYTISKPAEDDAADDAETADDADAQDNADAQDDADAADAAETEEETAEEPETEPVDAQAMADAIDGTDEETFTAYLEENVGEGTAPISTSLPGASLNANYADFLLDSAREPGDATVAETDTTTYVVMFLGRDANDYHLVDFRHILIMAQDTDGDGQYSDEEKQAAEDQAQELYSQWQDGDATEDSFAQLANDNSADSGSNTNGGLYEDVYKGVMVDPINDWLFEDGRQAGDTAVVSYDGPNYTGTHVLYFTGEADMSYAQYQADTTLRSDAYDSWMEQQMAGYEATTSNLTLVGKNH